MGFFDSKSEQSSASGASGAQTQDGNPLSLNLTSGKGLDLKNASFNITTQTTATDHGAIEGAFDFADRAGEVAADVAIAGLDSGVSIARDGIYVAESALTLGRDVVEVLDENVDRGFGFAGDVITDTLTTIEAENAGARSLVRDALTEVSSAGRALLDRTESLARDTFGFAERQVADARAGFRDSLNFAEDVNSDFQHLVGDLFLATTDELAVQNERAVATISNFAERTTQISDQRVLTFGKVAMAAVVVALTLPPAIRAFTGAKS
jgi:hypothetical protein